MGKLGQLLVARGWITVQQLTRALKNQNVVGGRLGTCLLEMDAITEDLLQKGLSEQLGVPAVRVEELRGIPEEVQELLPAKLARRCRAIPFRALGGRLDVAMLDARNLACQDEIAFATGKRVRVHVGNEIRIFEALEKYYDEECPSRFATLLDRLNRSRYLWEKDIQPTPGPHREVLAPLEGDPFARPPRMQPPPELPDVPPPTPAPAPPRRPRVVLPATGPSSIAPAVRPPTSAAALFAATPQAPAAAPTPKAPPPPAPPIAPIAATTPVAAPPRPAPPARPRSLPLSPDEQALLHGSEVRQPTPIPPIPPPIPAMPPAPPAAPAPAVSPIAPPQDLAAALQALALVRDREEVGDLLLGFLGLRYRRVVLFQANKEGVAAWRAKGAGIDLKAFSSFSVGFDRPSIFLNLRGGSGLHLGPLAPMPAHRELAATWGGELPRDCVMMPVRLRERLVAVIYADRAESGPPGLHLEELKRLTDATVAAFERCILFKKQAVRGA
jgi:hypothetical protein